MLKFLARLAKHKKQDQLHDKFQIRDKKRTIRSHDNPKNFSKGRRVIRMEIRISCLNCKIQEIIPKKNLKARIP